MAQPAMRRRILLVLSLLLVTVGCRDKEKEVQEKIVPALEEATPLIERDTKQVREGLPKGAALLTKHLDADPGSDLEGVKRAIDSARAGTDELVVAKSTFFAFVGDNGVVLRSESEPDLPAGKSLIEAIPEAKKFLSPDAGLVEVWGYMEGLRGVNKGGDMQWVVGHPVKSADGKLLGAFITGWSLRLYAKYLEDHIQIHLKKGMPDPAKPPPLAYVFIVKGDKAFGGPVTPDENAEAIGALGLVDKTKNGIYQQSLELDGRNFFIAAMAAPAMGSDVVIVLMMSPV